MTIETLHENEWLSLKKVIEPKLKISGYVFSHESRCKGRIIAILPHRNTGRECTFLVKKEITPCWGLEPAFSAITGGWEGGNPLDDAQRELFEECGYDVPVGFFKSLGTCRASKSSDTLFHLYTCNLSGVTPRQHTGDGSHLETIATSHWVTAKQLMEMGDSQLHVMYNRMSDYISTPPREFYK